MKLLDTTFNKKKIEEASQYLTDRYIQHNPQVPSGKSGFLQAVPLFFTVFPALSWEMKHIWADGDYVIVHSLYKMGKDMAVVDVFRLKDGKADEHWDVIQEIPQKMAHDNGMF